MGSVMRKDIDSNPYVGERKAKGYVKVKKASHIDPFFNGTEDYSQVTNIRQGMIYPVVSVEGLGDCEDITIINDNGEEEAFADFFFEEVPDEKIIAK